MRVKVMLVIASFVYVMFCSGCSSIICGSEKTINVNSTPMESKFSIQNPKGKIIAQGVTPTNVTLKRGSGWFKAGDYTIKLEKAGYKTATFPVEQGLEVGWYGLGNLVFGGLIGWIIVDPATGAMWTIKDFNATLQPESAALNERRGEPLPQTKDTPQFMCMKIAKNE